MREFKNITSKRSPLRKFTALIVIFIIGLVWMIGMVSAYFHSPCGYSITESSVIIHQRHPEKQILIPIKEITSVRRDVKGDYRIGWMLLKKGGSSCHGIFGTFGSFSTFKFGWVDLYYVTNRNNLVVLEGKRKIVISPDTPERFIALLKEKLEE